MSQPLKRTLTDAERIAILNKELAEVTKRFNLISRDEFSAIIHQKGFRLTKSDIFWSIVVSIISFGLGLILVVLYFFMKYRANQYPYLRIAVTESGEVVQTPLESIP